jgi:hypothetical protein
MFPQPVINLWLIGPAAARRFHVVLDTGAECCLFPEWVAWQTGLHQSSASPTLGMGSQVSRTGWSAWFARVELEVRDPAAILPPFRWPAVVGFTGRGSFGTTSVAGVLGVNGGLDRFRRVEFDWSALSGPEVVLRT